MQRNPTMVMAIALSASLLFAPAFSAEKAPAKEAVKDAAKAPAAAAKKAGGQQVKSETASATATAKAAKAFAQVSAELYPKAKQEGNLIVYSVWDVEHLRVITEAFMKRYPGIKATFWQGRNPGNRYPRSNRVPRRPGELRCRAFRQRAAGDPRRRRQSCITTRCSAMSCICMIPIWPTVSLQIQALAFNTKKMKPAESAQELGRSGQSQVQRHDRARRSDARRAAELDARRFENSMEG